MKIVIFGIPGSGKTTFSRKLSKLTHTPIFHIDRHFFQKGGWVERSQEDFLNDVRHQLTKDSWIFDGNGMHFLEMRFKEADLVIYCARSRLLCIFRLIYRWLSTLGSHQPDSPEGASKSISLRLLKYLWNYSKRYQPMINSLKERYPDVEFIELRSKHDFNIILKRFQKLSNCI